MVVKSVVFVQDETLFIYKIKFFCVDVPEQEENSRFKKLGNKFQF